MPRSCAEGIPIHVLRQLDISYRPCFPISAAAARVYSRSQTKLYRLTASYVHAKKKVPTGECPSVANNATMLSILHPPNSFTSCHQQPQPPHTGRRVVARVVWLYTRTNMASRARRVGRTQDEDVSVVADLEKALQPRRHLAKHMSTSMHMHFHLCTYVQPEMGSQAQSVIGAQQGLHPHRSQHHPSGPTSFPTPTPTARGPSPIAVR
jgi:hypothetical protein